jgi:hypothetical protein
MQQMLLFREELLRPGVDDSPVAAWQHAAGNLPPEDEAAKATDPPHRLEICRLCFERRPPNRVARIVNAHLNRADAFQPVENIDHSGLLLSVTGCCDRVASSCHDFINDQLEGVRRPPGYRHLIAFPCEASGRRSAESTTRPDANYPSDPAHICHGLSPSSQQVGLRL